MLKQVSIDKRWLYGVGLLIFIPVICWCGFYLIHDHSYIGHWFLGLSTRPVIYEDQFLTTFFTPAVKEQGNYWCALGLLFSIGAIAFLGWKWKQNAESKLVIKTCWSRKQIAYSALLLLIMLSLWLFGNHQLHYCPDELYSANNIASLHPFQALSYYMDVNNHLLFNQLNSLLFGWASDKTQTGRIISLLSYLASTLLVHHCMGLFIRNKAAAFFATVLLMSHMTVWGWAISGRGYALYTMAAWLSVLSVYHYHHSRRTIYLITLLCGTFIGYTTLPTFLYFHPSLILVSIIIQFKERCVDRRFWRYQVMAGILVLLFYIPCLSISGLAAITSNRHVPKPETYAILTWDMYRYFRYYLNTLFLGEPKHLLGVVYLLFILPIFNIIRTKKQALLIGGYFVVLWVSVVVVSLVIKTFTAPRTLSPQLHISFTLTLLTIYLLMNKFLKFIPRKWIIVLFCTMCLVVSACLVLDNSSHIALTLYGK